MENIEGVQRKCSSLGQLKSSHSGSSWKTREKEQNHKEEIDGLLSEPPAHKPGERQRQ